MLRPLANVRRRVEQLATQTGSGRCEGHHRRTRFIDVVGDEPMPPWPEAERGAPCACGAALEYFTIVDQHLAASP